MGESDSVMFSCRLWQVVNYLHHDLKSMQGGGRILEDVQPNEENLKEVDLYEEY